MSHSAYGFTTTRTEELRWDRFAACRHHPDWFVVKAGPTSKLNHRALALCRSCPVLATCREKTRSMRFHGMVVAGEIRWDGSRI